MVYLGSQVGISSAASISIVDYGKSEEVYKKIVGEIIGRMEKKGLKLVSAKMLVMTSSMAEKHYEIHNHL